MFFVRIIALLQTENALEIKVCEWRFLNKLQVVKNSSIQTVTKQ